MQAELSVGTWGPMRCCIRPPRGSNHMLNQGEQHQDHEDQHITSDATSHHGFLAELAQPEPSMPKQDTVGSLQR